VPARRLAKSAPVPCIVQARDTHAEEDPLAKNLQRVSPHPLGQFWAFRSLREERGMSEEAIAVAFFITPAIVKQRLKLTGVSPKLLEVYAEDARTLEQLMAFTVSGGCTSAGSVDCRRALARQRPPRPRSSCCRRCRAGGRP
jgi:ParB family chromosome partitioning protein